MSEYLFNGWSPLVRLLIVGIAAYISLILLLRISGKRTLAQMNAFDLVITVAFGSSLSSVLVSKTVSLSEGVLAFLILISMQYVIASISVRIPKFGKIVKAEPRVLFRSGKILKRALQEERVREDELLQAVRNQGLKSLDQVDTIILETNGSFSIVKKSATENESAISNVHDRSV